MPNDNSFIRPVVDEDDMVLLMQNHYNKWVKSGSTTKVPDQNTLDTYQKMFLWKDKAELLDAIFGAVLKPKLPGVQVTL